MSTFSSAPQQASSHDTAATSSLPTSHDPSLDAAPIIDRSLGPESAETTASQNARNLEKRRLLALAGKKDGDMSGKDAPADNASTSANAALPAAAQDSTNDPSSPGRSISPYSDAASPHRHLRSTSPRHLSPATSMIFERDVQENTLAPELADSVPAHIQTEDHIPAVLEASSLAITDEKLGPDDVEIVMSAAHQPAVTVASSNLGEAHSMVSHSELPMGRDMEESGSTYGALDTTDPRRLSFISFADVVHQEHAENKDPITMLGMTSAGGSIAGNRSPSPIRSPASSHIGRISPPTGGDSFPRGADTSPIRGLAPIGSPLSGHSTIHGELTIETMRQTLEKTGSNDQPLGLGIAEDGRRPSRASAAGL